MRTSLAAHLGRLARLALGAAIILTPFRYRLALLARPRPPLYADYTDFLLFASDLFVLALLGLWAVSLMVEPRRPSRGPLFLLVPMLGLIGTGIVSAIFSVDPALSLYHSLRLVLLAGLYLYVVNEFQDLGSLILPVALQVFIQAAVGVAQTLRQHSLGLGWMGELELDPAWNGVSIVWADGFRSLRAYGLSDHPNVLGGCLAFALILIAVWFVNADARWRAPAGALFAFGALGLFLTFSRAAWLALGGGMLAALVLFWRTGQRRALGDGLGLLGAAAIVAAPFVWQNAGYLGVRLNTGDSSAQPYIEKRSLDERAALAEAANKLFADHALTGVGLGALPLALYRADPEFPFDFQPAHNALLDAAAETGVFGALFYFGALTGPWIALWLNRRRLAHVPVLLGLSGLLLAVTLVGLFDYYSWLLAPGRLWQWFAWGLWGAVYQASFRGAQDA